MQIPVRIYLDNCGYGETFYVNIEVQPSWNCYGYYYTATPNPAEDELVVSYQQEADGAVTEDTKAQQFEVTLYDEKGKAVRRGKNASKVNKVVLDTRTLPNGTYILHITDEKETIKRQNLIQHQ
ncbi:T9SS type A sorting domain-containing protein [Botryobacter ruber]|uniref:T9SS type A sorting domain-containing protein n=1 Tax=Botryobacter ruber TaxID=2171629 RepID=UPI0013E40EC3|nr:T9SS type A sorting domain-containing protein [Botryobacter ruber]